MKPSGILPGVQEALGPLAPVVIAHEEREAVKRLGTRSGGNEGAPEDEGESQGADQGVRRA